MSEKITAVLDRIETEQQQAREPPISKNVSMLELAEMVVRGEVRLSSQQTARPAANALTPGLNVKHVSALS